MIRRRWRFSLRAQGRDSSDDVASKSGDPITSVPGIGPAIGGTNSAATVGAGVARLRRLGVDDEFDLDDLIDEGDAASPADRDEQVLLLPL